MKKGFFVFIPLFAVLAWIAIPVVFAGDEHRGASHHDHMEGEGDSADGKVERVPGGTAHEHADRKDGRISLGLSPMMRSHQHAEMREHFKGVQMIVKGISEGDFETASKAAHEKLGLTPEVAKMCDLMPNQQFREIGIAFHNAGDELGEVLLKRDVTSSLKSLEAVLAKCASCHEKFRQ